MFYAKINSINGQKFNNNRNFQVMVAMATICPKIFFHQFEDIFIVHMTCDFCNHRIGALREMSKKPLKSCNFVIFSIMVAMVTICPKFFFNKFKGIFNIHMICDFCEHRIGALKEISPKPLKSCNFVIFSIMVAMVTCNQQKICLNLNYWGISDHISSLVFIL